MSTSKTILLIVADLLTFGIGTWIAVHGVIDGDEDMAGGGAFLVVFGMLIRRWTSILKGKGVETQPSTPVQNSALPLLFILVFLGHSYTQNAENKKSINRAESDISRAESRVSDIEYSIYR